MVLHFSDKLPRYIWADSVRLRQVLINLLGNAVKFTEEGKVELIVELVPDLKFQGSGESNTEALGMRSETVRFSVHDTGIGIKPENQSKIFQAFSQEDSTTSKKFGGTGLGLAISNRLLAIMGSKLHLKSEPGKGSTFYFEAAFKAQFKDAGNEKQAETNKKDGEGKLFSD